MTLLPLLRRRAFVSCAAIALIAAGCKTPPAPPRVDNLPMYGQPEIPRPTQLRQADERFIETAAAEFGGDRKLASLSWTAQADRYLEEGNLDLAMRRYNQAWLLDESNYEAHWGFARVLLAQQKPSDALPHLRKAIELCKDPAQRAILNAELTRLGTATPSS